MPQVRTIESRIQTFEGFRVAIVTPAGSNVRSDKDIPNQYNDHKNRAADTMTVEGWKKNRFRPQFAGYEVEVLNGDGSVAHGRTQLRRVRATYAKDASTAPSRRWSVINPHP